MSLHHMATEAFVTRSQFAMQELIVVHIHVHMYVGLLVYCKLQQGLSVTPLP